MSLERLWAGWRSEYVTSAAASAGDGPAAGDDGEACVMCRIVGSSDDRAAYVVHRGALAVVALNAFPYTSGHLMIMPTRHVAEPDALRADESTELWSTVTAAVAALRSAFRPDGLNLGANLGRVAGAGVPGHFHVHVLPRWNGDTNFMTTVAEARVLPEALPASWEKLRAAWEGNR